MMISTKGRYALRVMLDLAGHMEDGYIPLAEIAARQHISEKYLESILSVLSKAGMLSALRGKGGGYKLAKAPEDYSVYDILCLTEGTLAPGRLPRGGSELRKLRRMQHLSSLAGARRDGPQLPRGLYARRCAAHEKITKSESPAAPEPVRRGSFICGWKARAFPAPDAAGYRTPQRSAPRERA